MGVMKNTQEMDATESLPGTLVPQVSLTMEDTIPVDEWPDGDMIPLNARRLTLVMLHRIGEALGVSPSSSASCPDRD